MNRFHRRLAVLVFFVLLISAVVIYFTVDMNTLTSLTLFQPWSIALAILAVAVGLFFDGTRLMHLVHLSNEDITLKEAVEVVFGNYFLALLTPGATGGAVAQMMFLRHAGVPTGKATVVVIVRTAMSILFLICCLPFIFFHDDNILPGVSNGTLIVISFTTFLLIMAIVAAVKYNFIDQFAVNIARRLSRYSKRRGRAFLRIYRDTKLATSLLSASPIRMTYIFFESGISLIFIYAIVPCLLFGLGVTQADWYTVMGRMIFLNMLLYFTPTPGGSGIAEGGFVFLFSALVPPGTVGILAVAWRIIAEYLPFVIGLYYTIAVFGENFLNRQSEQMDELEMAESMEEIGA